MSVYTDPAELPEDQPAGEDGDDRDNESQADDA